MCKSLLTCLLLTLAAPWVTAADGATAVVEKLHAALLSTMKDATTLGYQGRLQRLTPVIAECFDFNTIARAVTGPHWKGLTAEKREQFIATFEQLSVATYAENFSGYSGETFETVAQEDVRGATVVKTVIIVKDGRRVSLNYVVTHSAERWGIVNVIAQGVSDLALKRTEYEAVISAQGIDALIAKLDAKVASYAASGK
ncbi:MAG: hopanoid biosynthesis protein HpnM [Gammaproteobacteria bacterium]|nr:hopanoid biosynthesis protein HpnM [Gammaproteobacteria bacterium]